jgi:hypothetical protein
MRKITIGFWYAAVFVNLVTATQVAIWGYTFLPFMENLK